LSRFQFDLSRRVVGVHVSERLPFGRLRYPEAIRRIGLWICALGLSIANQVAHGSIAYVQGGSQVPDTGGSVSVTYTSAQTAGDLNVVMVGWSDSSSTVQSISDSKGNTYVAAIGPTVSSGNASQILYYAKNIRGATAGSNTVTVTFSATVDFPEVRILEYSGIDPVNPFDVGVGASGVSVAQNSGPLTTTNANDLLVAGNYLFDTTTGTDPAYTQRLGTDGGDVVQDRVVTSVGTYSATSTQDGPDWWLMQLAAFRAAAVGGDTTPPSAPTGLTATAASGTQINLSWTASTDNVGVTGYLIERCQGTTCTFAQIGTSTTTTYSDSGLLASTSYSYRVRATDASSNLSGYSNTSSATTTASGTDTQPPTRPTGLSGTSISNSQINLTWTASTDNVGVTGYRVERCPVANCTAFTLAGSPTSTTYSDTALTSATSYIYRVRAVDAAGNASVPSAFKTLATQGTDSQAPTPPTTLAANPAGSSSIELTWWASSDNVGVSSYLVERCPGAGCSNFAQVGTAPATSYLDSGLTAASAYTYRVRASDAAGNLSSYSSTASVTTSQGGTGSVQYVYDDAGRLKLAVYGNGSNIQYSLDAAGNRNQVAGALDAMTLQAPTGLSGAWIGTSGISLSWGACTDTSGSALAGYQIYRSDHGTAVFATTTTNSYSDTAVTVGSSYTYTVACFDNATPANTSAQSTSVTVKPTPPTAPVLSASVINATQVNLTWTPSVVGGGTTLSGYKIFRGSTQIASIGLVTSYSDLTTTGNATYTYQVVAFDPLGDAVSSNQVSVTTPAVAPTAPSGLTATVISASEVDLSWTGSTDTGGPGLQDYVITRTSSAGSTTVHNTTTSYHDTSVAGSTSYSYTVYAEDTAGRASPVSNTAQVTTPLAIPSVPGTPGPTGRILTSPFTEGWAASTGPVSYYILNRNDGTNITNFTITAPATTSSQTGVNGESINFHVQACNSNNQCSAQSGAAIVTLCTIPGECQ
jgi:fibronectin type 3 domain-containing protein